MKEKEEKVSYKIFIFSTIYHIKYWYPEGYCPIITLFRDEKKIISAPMHQGKFDLKNALYHNAKYLKKEKLFVNKIKKVNRFQIDYIYESDLKYTRR